MEQTVDFRSDLYSIGIVLYELFTESLPFESQDKLELIHEQIARVPTPPKSINNLIPNAINNIIIKLLSKNPNGRYQTAAGLAADLARCVRELADSDSEFDFPIAKDDKDVSFRIPEKLYGREDELAALTTGLNDACKGETKLILIAGYSGVGKTSLVHAIRRRIVESSGIFIEGKYDQYQREIPCSAITAAFDQYVSQILAEPEGIFNYIKHNLQKALGDLGRVVTDVVPTLTKIVGEQPKVPELSGQEAAHRFEYVFNQFVCAIAEATSPLVLFIDDLQWVDPSSLNLLSVFLNNKELSGLLILGAYRDNEVDPTHPLNTTISELSHQGINVQTLEINNLAQSHVDALVMETLNRQESAGELSNLLFQKTQGNPFFLRRLLNNLNGEGLINWDFSSNGWDWDLDSIVELEITDNVVEFLVTKLKKLPEKTVSILTVAACIGNRFDISILEVVTAHDRSELIDCLQIAIDSNMLGFRDDNFYFVHDRIHQAAYSMLSENEKNETHLSIGRLLFKNYDQRKNVDLLFDITTQYNQGIILVQSPEEKMVIARLNLEAGIKARDSIAYQQAIIFF